MKNENEFSCLFDHKIILLAGLYKAIRNNIVAKKTTELVLIFHKKITKLVFLWPNMSQLCFKVLRLCKLAMIFLKLLSKLDKLLGKSPYHMSLYQA